MKKISAFILFVVMTSITAMAQESTLYGKKFDTKTAIPAEALAQRMGDQKEMPVTVRGTIAEVCQSAGCWITLKNENGENLFVKIKEHEFSIPKDMAGHRAIVKGTAVRKTVSIEEQKHYAEDAGKSEADIAAIKEPKTEIRINAAAMVIE